MSFVEGIKGVWEKTKKYWIKRLDTHHKKLSGGFGAMSTTIIISYIIQVIQHLNGSGADWSTFGICTMTAVGMFLTMLISSMFGNGNGTEEK